MLAQGVTICNATSEPRRSFLKALLHSLSPQEHSPNVRCSLGRNFFNALWCLWVDFPILIPVYTSYLHELVSRHLQVPFPVSTTFVVMSARVEHRMHIALTLSHIQKLENVVKTCLNRAIFDRVVARA